MISVAERFLQTAVIVDDEAFATRGSLVVPAATLGNETLNGDSPAPNQETKLNVDVGELDIEAVVSGFADYGIVCAAIAPKGTSETDKERVLKLARRSDVVVLDWRITDGAGGTTTSLEFLSAIVEGDERLGHRLRLICIYTGDAEIESIVSRVHERLEADPGAPAVMRSGNQLSVGSLRVFVIPKMRADGRHLEGAVDSSSLAGTVVEKFDEFASSGLMPALTLSAIAALRDNAHRVLARFSADHDAAFLSHRALTSPNDAEQLALGMLSEEFGSVISTANVAESIADAEVASRAASLLNGAVEPRYVAKSNQSKSKQLSHEYALKLVVEGTDKDDQAELDIHSRFSLEGYRSVSRLLLGSDHDESARMAREADLGFSVLSNMVREIEHEGSMLPAPGLFLGAIVRRKRGRKPVEYLLCVQPLCDSVRLDNVAAFPFLPLHPVGEDKPCDVVVRDEGQFVRLSSKGSTFAHLSMDSFGPDEIGSVRASWSGTGWVYKSTRRTAYHWIGQLRSAKALGIVTVVAGNASRVAQDEYRFLQLGGN